MPEAHSHPQVPVAVLSEEPEYRHGREAKEVHPEEARLLPVDTEADGEDSDTEEEDTLSAIMIIRLT